MDLALAGRAEGGEEAKHKNGLPGAQPSPRVTPSNTPLLPDLLSFVADSTATGGGRGFSLTL
jgi:hypothetical protein